MDENPYKSPRRSKPLQRLQTDPEERRWLLVLVGSVLELIGMFGLIGLLLAWALSAFGIMPQN